MIVGTLGHVEADEDPRLGRSELEDGAVVESLERRFTIECAHIVPAPGEAFADVPNGNVRVEQEPHAR